MPVEYLTPAIEGRAVEVQQLLADRGHHRAPALPDWLSHLEELPRHRGVSGATAVREARDELP